MSYRLVLELPFKTIVVHKKRFDTEEEATGFMATVLPDGFQVVDEEEYDLTGAIEVPFKEPKTK